MSEIITLPRKYEEGGPPPPKSSASPLQSCNAAEVELERMKVCSAGEWKVQQFDYLCYFRGASGLIA